MYKEQFKCIAFAACLTLTGVMVSCADVESDGIYYNITSSTDLEVEVTYKDTSYNSYSGDIEIPSIVKYNNKIYTVTSIGDSAFRGCKSLTSIVIPDGVTSIGEEAFEYCESLTSIDLPEGLTSIGNSAFLGCESLTSIDLPEGLTSIGDAAFLGCEGPTSIDLPEGLTSIGSFSFSNCTSQTSIDLPDGLTNIGNGAFYFFTSLTSIDVNENNTYYSSSDGVLYNKDKTILICYPCRKTNSTFSIPESVTEIGSYAFHDCRSLVSIDLPDGLTSIGSFSFSNCTSLTSIDLPDGLTSIGGCAFSACTSLTSIDLPDGMTSIGNFAFDNCTSLTSIDLPDGLTSIGNHAFESCESLKDVYSRNVTPPTCAGSDVFDDTTYENATLHVPSKVLTRYQTTSQWSKFNNIVGDATNNGNSRRVHK